MNASVNADIGIREIRQLTSFIKEKYGVDYTEYALTSFKRRVERIMDMGKFGLDTLLRKLESPAYLDHFMGQIAVGATELFRDPTFWLLLKNIYLTNLLREHNKIRIWLPMCASGEEFYSLAILLKESGWTQRTEIYVSGMSDENLSQIEKGHMEVNKLEISTKNYGRFQGLSQFSYYYKEADNAVYFDQSLFANTKIFKQNLRFDNDLPLMHLILFRNQMIYYNSTLQYKVCDILHGKLTAKGLLALGILEEIELNNVNNKFAALDKEESVYQRRN